MELGWCTTLAMVKENEMENNMKNLKELTTIAKLLGEENEKRLKDAITDALIQTAEDDIRERYKYDYIIAFDSIYEEVNRELQEEMKTKMAEKYREHMEKELKKMFGD